MKRIGPHKRHPGLDPGSALFFTDPMEKTPCVYPRLFMTPIRHGATWPKISGLIRCRWIRFKRQTPDQVRGDGITGGINANPLKLVM